MKVAIVNENICTEIREVSESEYASLNCQIAIDVTDMNPVPEVGWTFDGSKLTGPISSMIITKLALRQRFTVSELMAIYNASTTNTFFKVLLDNVSVATFVDLKRPDTIAGLSAIYQYGIVSQERIEQILNTPPNSTEIYRG